MPIKPFIVVTLPNNTALMTAYWCFYSLINDRGNKVHSRGRRDRYINCPNISFSVPKNGLLKLRVNLGFICIFSAREKSV